MGRDKGVLTPIRRSDEADLLRLWNRSVPFDPLTAELLEEKIWSDLDFERGLGQVARVGGMAVGFGVAVRRPESNTGFIKMLAVDPDYRRLGIGHQLLENLESSLLSRGVKEIRVAESAPNYLNPGIDVRYTPGWLLFEKHGYERFTETLNLSVDLAARSWDTENKESVARDNGFFVRRAEAEDRNRLGAFLSTHWAAWLPEVRVAFWADPKTVFIAEHEDKCVAFAAWNTNNIGTGWFGPMGTDPEYQGRGLGSILLYRCLADMKMRGDKSSVIPWVGPVGFYSHHAGAIADRVFYRYRLPISTS